MKQTNRINSYFFLQDSIYAIIEDFLYLEFYLRFIHKLRLTSQHYQAQLPTLPRLI